MKAAVYAIAAFSIAALLAMTNVVAAAPGSIAAIGDLPAPRAAHSATRLGDGRVLLAGGCVANGCEEGIAADALFYQPETGRFEAGPRLHQARVGHRAVALDDGSVLLFGGWTRDGATASIERFDPASGRFEAHGDMLTARDGFTATRLPDGRILIVGGYRSDMQRIAQAELYDPRTRRSTPTGNLAVARKSHTATLLPDGRVLIAAGSDSRSSVTATLELFDAERNAFIRAGELAKARQKHAAVLVGDDVLILGGAGMPEHNGYFADSERWNLRSGEVRDGPTMAQRRYKFLDAVVLLADGAVLVAGGGSHAERLAAGATRFEPVDAAIGSALAFATATPLCGGGVLIAGGYDPDIRVRRGAWIFSPAAAPSGKPAAATATNTETSC